MFETTTAKTQTDVSNKNPTHTLTSFKQKTWIFCSQSIIFNGLYQREILIVKNHFVPVTSFQSKIQRALSFRDSVVYEQVPALQHSDEPEETNIKIKEKIVDLKIVERFPVSK